ncbi:hypothetical protein OPIT5_01245 [Opitutaceae bacterium TAV5]|nr:hypothetical protein OPIT5_01245 [Opitutaceae bacterium TAV5]
MKTYRLPRPAKNIVVAALLALIFPAARLPAGPVTIEPTPTASAEATKTPALADALKNLREGYAKAFVAAGGNLAGSGSSYEWRSLDGFTQALDNIGQMMANNSPDEALRQLRRLARTAPTPEMTTLLENYVAAIDADLKTREADALKRINALLDASFDALAAARKPEDINPTLEQLAGVGIDYENVRYNTVVGRARNAAANMHGYAVRWQNYLVQKNIPDDASARQSLESLANNVPGELPPALRVRIVKHMTALRNASQPAAVRRGALLAKADELFAAATLDTLEQTADDLRALETSPEAKTARSGEKNALTRLYEPLDRLAAATRYFKEDRAPAAHELLRPAALPSATRLLIACTPGLERLWDAWYFKAVPKLTGLADRLTPPRDNEHAQTYVARLYDEAVDAGHWPDAAVLAQLERDLRPGGDCTCGQRQAATVGKNPAAAIEAFLQGQLLEKARQPKAAAAAYQDALRQGAPSKLEDLIIERLKTLNE